MVFQSYAIWPHMDVFENIAFPLRRGRLKMPKEEVSVRVGEGAGDARPRCLGGAAGHHLERRPAAAGGAGAGAGAAARILLMDEPLSNLDFKLQVRLRAQMRDLMHRLNLTTIHVTHNQAEALETGDRIAVMSEGTHRPDRRSAVHLPSSGERVRRAFHRRHEHFPGGLPRGNGGTARVETPFGHLEAQLTSRDGFAAGRELHVGDPPGGHQDRRRHSGGRRHLVTGTVASSSYVGEGYVHTVESCGQPVRIRRHHREAIHRGDSIRLHFPPAETVVVAPSDGLDMEGLEGGLAGEDAARAS